eukprot:747942-Hanusia_phi.AAC.2
MKVLELQQIRTQSSTPRVRHLGGEQLDLLLQKADLSLILGEIYLNLWNSWFRRGATTPSLQARKRCHVEIANLFGFPRVNSTSYT